MVKLFGNAYQFFAALMMLMFVLALAALPLQASEPRFELIKIADGIYAAIRTEPPGLTVNANTVFIINENDVVVVDTTLTPGTAREEIAALKRITNKPVRYVINTHWHDDHIMGNQAYKEAFPGVEFIAHGFDKLVAAFLNLGVDGRQSLLAGKQPRRHTNSNGDGA